MPNNLSSPSNHLKHLSQFLDARSKASLQLSFDIKQAWLHTLLERELLVLLCNDKILDAAVKPIQKRIKNYYNELLNEKREQTRDTQAIVAYYHEAIELFGHEVTSEEKKRISEMTDEISQYNGFDSINQHFNAILEGKGSAEDQKNVIQDLESVLCTMEQLKKLVEPQLLQGKHELSTGMGTVSSHKLSKPLSPQKIKSGLQLNKLVQRSKEEKSIKALQATLEETETTLAQAKEQLGKMQTSHDSMLQRFDIQKEENNTHVQKLESEQTKVRQLNHQLDSFKRQGETAKSEIENLQNQLSQQQELHQKQSTTAQQDNISFLKSLLNTLHDLIDYISIIPTRFIEALLKKVKSQKDTSYEILGNKKSNHTINRARENLDSKEKDLRILIEDAVKDRQASLLPPGWIIPNDTFLSKDNGYVKYDLHAQPNNTVLRLKDEQISLQMKHVTPFTMKLSFFNDNTLAPLTHEQILKIVNLIFSQTITHANAIIDVSTKDSKNTKKSQTIEDWLQFYFMLYQKFEETTALPTLSSPSRTFEEYFNTLPKQGDASIANIYNSLIRMN